MIAVENSDHAADDLQQIIERAAHLLPAQGPITVFIHHNPLHALEHIPFLQGVRKGSQILGCQPFLSEERYRDALIRGRIRSSELADVLRKSLGANADDRVLGTTTRFELRLAMLQFPLRFGPTAELLWFVAETDALRLVRCDVSSAVRGKLIAETRRWVMRDLRKVSDQNGIGSSTGRHDHVLDAVFERFRASSIESWSQQVWETFTLQALWRVCLDGVVSEVPASAIPQAQSIRHRDLLYQLTGVDCDLPVHDLLIRFSAAFLDQGMASWPMPRREQGFFRAFCALYRRGSGIPEPWLGGLTAEINRLEAQRIGALESIRESLVMLGVEPGEREEFISATLLVLRGWGGMIHELAMRSDSVSHPIPGGSPIEFLAVRLLLDRLALSHATRDSVPAPLQLLRNALRQSLVKDLRPSGEQRAFLVFQLAQVFGWSPSELHRLDESQWDELLKEIEDFNSLERRQTFHLAYEQRFRIQTLDALALHAPKSFERTARPRAQLITCLDEREESFRRHLEEIAPDIETFGAAGFFAVAMYYRGADDAHFVPLCPIVIKPNNWVCEDVDPSHEEIHRKRTGMRRIIGTASHRLHFATRSFFFGAILATILGALAAIPLVARILFPRLTARSRRSLARFVRSPNDTHLRLERQETEAGPENGEVGFSLDEMVNIAERLLQDIGLRSGFARLVVTLGHGSNSLNNPHKSAYDCGACGGSPGAANARTLSQILNDPRVRTQLEARFITIPPDTWFLGGFHNTCNDSVHLFDVALVPASHRGDLEAIQKNLETACERNAHERCRRFMSAPLTLTLRAARQHVEARSEDLAQTRPELGHASNAICLVGRRRWSRGLFLDRRAFLTSYDPTQDDENATILTRTLSAVFPVCGGINLEYYFSHIDSAGFGCGTKLPHNLTSLLGVMDGAASDLRTGLPWQMVEIHEPIRLLAVVETTPEKLLQILDRNESIGRLARNGWVQLATQDSATGKLRFFENGEFQEYYAQAEILPKAESSIDWYRGWREHLEFAEIEG